MRRALSLEFRFLFFAILGVIVPFGLLLYFFPKQTDFYWAWAIPEPRSARLIGAGYFGAIFYYLLALRENDWLQIQSGLGGQIVFSFVLLLATMIHWDTFKPYHPITLVWLAFYYGGPFLVPVFYRAEAARAGGQSGAGADIAPAWHTWLVARGVFYLALALLGIVFAATVSAVWPWPIRPLELTVSMGQVAVVGWQSAAAVMAGRLWRRHRLGLVLTAAIGLVQLVGLFINATPYNWSSPAGSLLPLMFVEWLVTPLVMLFLYRKQSQ